MAQKPPRPQLDRVVSVVEQVASVAVAIERLERLAHLLHWPAQKGWWLVATGWVGLAGAAVVLDLPWWLIGASVLGFGLAGISALGWRARGRSRRRGLARAAAWADRVFGANEVHVSLIEEVDSGGRFARVLASRCAPGLLDPQPLSGQIVGNPIAGAEWAARCQQLSWALVALAALVVGLGLGRSDRGSEHWQLWLQAGGELGVESGAEGGALRQQLRSLAVLLANGQLREADVAKTLAATRRQRIVQRRELHGLHDALSEAVRGDDQALQRLLAAVAKRDRVRVAEVLARAQAPKSANPVSAVAALAQAFATDDVADQEAALEVLAVRLAHLQAAALGLARVHAKLEAVSRVHGYSMAADHGWSGAGSDVDSPSDELSGEVPGGEAGRHNQRRGARTPDEQEWSPKLAAVVQRYQRLRDDRLGDGRLGDNED